MEYQIRIFIGKEEVPANELSAISVRNAEINRAIQNAYTRSTSAEATNRTGGGTP